MHAEMEKYFAIRDTLEMEGELFRFASLVGTDASNPNRRLAEYVATLIMSFSGEQDWEQKALKAGWAKPDPTRILGDE